MDAARPFTTFNFEVDLRLESNDAICSGSFSECSGLELSISPKTIREGGNNVQQIHLPAAVSYGQLTLKRGMTKNWDLWNWFEDFQGSPGLRAEGEVVMLSSERNENVMFHLTGCMPIKIKAPGLNAKEGQIAIEEMQIAYETLYAEKTDNADSESR